MNKTRKYSPAQLKAMRQACGLSVIDVARATHLTRAHINTIERATYTGDLPVRVIDYLESAYKEHITAVKHAYNAALDFIAKTEAKAREEGREPELDGVDISWRRIKSTDDKLANARARDLMLLLAMDGHKVNITY